MIAPRTPAATCCSSASGRRRRSSGLRIWSRIELMVSLPQSPRRCAGQTAQVRARGAEAVGGGERRLHLGAHALARGRLVGDAQDRALVAPAVEQVVDELEREA